MQVMRHISKAIFLVGAIASFMATRAMADVATETSTIGDFTITLYLQDFLTEDDLTTLRLVAQDKNALALFVPAGGGFAALAASPEDGFTKDGMPARSASAISGLPDAATAATQAIAACQAASKAKATCVVLLEVAPNQ
jgi:hypothetical protein